MLSGIHTGLVFTDSDENRIKVSNLQYYISTRPEPIILKSIKAEGETVRESALFTPWLPPEHA